MSGIGFEADFSDLLERALRLGDLGLSLIDEILPEDLTMGTIPQATVYRLHLAAAVNYQAGIACLRTAQSSPAVLTLVRGLLEVWSHLAFLAEGEQGNDVRCRALQLEQGINNEWKTNMHIVPVSAANIEQRHRDILDLWEVYGCGNPKSRTRKDVEQSLKALAKRTNQSWIMMLWKSASAATHMYSSELLFHQTPDGEIELVWALPAQRSAWLKFLGASFDLATNTAAVVLDRDRGPEIARSFHDKMRVIVEHPSLV